MSILASGTKGAGKTYYALHTWAAGEIAGTGYPLLAVDPARVDTLAGIHHARDLREVFTRLYGDAEAGIRGGLHTAYSPTSEADFDKLTEGIAAAGEVVMLVDEIRFYASTRHVSQPMVALARAERNFKVKLGYTTQSYSDVSRDLNCVIDDFFLFRHVSMQDLDEIERRWGKDTRAEVETLPPYKFVHRKVGF
jgi:hypothetical protein